MSQPPPFADLTNCFKCGTGFGLFNRKHHCRNCGNTFCGGCSSKSIQLPQFGLFEPNRVCEECFRKVTENNNKKQDKEIQKTQKKKEEVVVKEPEVQVKAKVVCSCGMPLCICVEEKKEEVKEVASPSAANVPVTQTVHNVVHVSSRPTYLSGGNSHAKIDMSGDLPEQCRDAIKSGDLENVKKLVAAGVKVNWVDRQGQSLLHLAAIMSKNDIAMWLVEQGANILAKNAQNEGVLDVAPPALAIKMKNYKK